MPGEEIVPKWVSCFFLECTGLIYFVVVVGVFGYVSECADALMCFAVLFANDGVFVTGFEMADVFCFACFFVCLEDEQFVTVDWVMVFYLAEESFG